MRKMPEVLIRDIGVKAVGDPVAMIYKKTALLLCPFGIDMGRTIAIY